MKINVYDFDGTIYDGDSTFDFLKFLINKKKWLILLFPKFIMYFIAYKIKIIKKEKFKETIFSIFRYFGNIDDLVIEFWNIHKYNIKKFFKDKKNYNNVVIATASPEFLINPIKKMYNIKYLFGSIVDKKTGFYSGLNCHGVEKVNRIKKVYPDAIIYEMYSDDCSADKPLLDLAIKSYIVKKDSILPYNK